jgi:soluble lytic murein transglycosylase
MPWPAATFDWSAPAGRRAVRLIRLGFTHEAAAVVEDMEPVSGLDATGVQYARAHLLQSLGAYNRAYGIASRTFGSALRGPLDAKSRRYFHLAYPAAFSQLVNRAAGEFGLPPLLLLALMRQESAFNDRARSVASANGLLQIIPRTGAKIAARLGVDDYNFGVLQDPSVNVRFGAWYLAQLFTKFGGNPALAIGGYNAGPAAMAAWVDLRNDSSTDEFVEDIPYRETRHYVKRVLGNYAVYQALYGDAPLTLPDDVPDSYGDNVNF